MCHTAFRLLSKFVVQSPGMYYIEHSETLLIYTQAPFAHFSCDASQRPSMTGAAKNRKPVLHKLPVSSEPIYLIQHGQILFFTLLCN